MLQQEQGPLNLLSRCDPHMSAIVDGFRSTVTLATAHPICRIDAGGRGHMTAALFYVIMFLD